ncbi:glycosylated lysosomal membrane protein isoform X3 [Pseudochaenichthys georgianus]|uniref:glycosylated lysosomal membrane protein isoform X3 n=1 Tax=Pseudochaenichthys georgianus TaxID=52239 RepID=UPI00146CB014|nr:glycosylated lysosomal membrane protein isoform X3 [Pseudochaenichthys georgianus]
MAALRSCGAFCLYLFVLHFVSSESQSVFRGESFRRKLSVELNPGRPGPPSPGGDLLHVRAVGLNDTLHFLFCSQGAPTLLLVHTNSSSSTVEVDWPQFLMRNVSGSLRVEPERSILQSNAIVFSRLTVFDSEGRDQMLPRLLHSANSSQLEVWLDGLLPRASRSRFLLELQAVGGAYPLSRVEVRRSIDDEFTPTIFKVLQWLPPLNRTSQGSVFLQWKPVSYRRSPPSVEEGSPTRSSLPRPQRGEEAFSALITAFYAEPETFGINVSFGISGEPFYGRSRFLSWTVLLGVGTPPMDSFSSLPNVSHLSLTCVLSPFRTVLLGVGTPPMDSFSSLLHVSPHSLTCFLSP